MPFDKTTGLLIIGVLGGIFVIVSSILQYRDKRESDSKSEKERAKTESYRKQIMSLQHKNFDVANSTLKKIEIAADKLDQSVALASFTLDNITGGNNTPILNIHVSLVEPRGYPKFFSITFSLTNNGDNKLENIETNVIDQTSNFVYTFADLEIQYNNGVNIKFVPPDQAQARLLRYKMISTNVIQSLTPKSMRTFHIATFPAEQIPNQNLGTEFQYPLTVYWGGGQINYEIRLKIVGKKVEMEKCSVRSNNKELTPQSNFIKFIHY